MTRHTHTTRCSTYYNIYYIYSRRQEPGSRDCGSRPPPVYIIVIIFMCIRVTILYTYYTYNRYVCTPAVVRLGSASGQDESRRRNRNLFLGCMRTRARARERLGIIPTGTHTHTHSHIQTQKTSVRPG